MDGNAFFASSFNGKKKRESRRRKEQQQQQEQRQKAATDLPPYNMTASFFLFPDPKNSFILQKQDRVERYSVTVAAAFNDLSI